MQAETKDADAAQLAALGYTAKFDRSMSLWENFALGFTYLSPVVGVYSVFDLGLSTGGPPMLWSYFLAGAGQFLVCLIFGEVVSQFPISGGLYPWARRLVGKRWAWMAGWIYGWALFTTIAAVAVGAGPFLATLLGFTDTPMITTAIALGLIALSTAVNLAGTKLLARVAMFGFVCEILGAIVVGGYLLLFQRHQPFAVVFDTFGIGAGGSYFPAFMAAAVVGLFTCYGFEACGDVAEETPNPGVAIPRAMRMTIYVGMTAAAFVCFALILAQPDIGAVISGKLTDPVEALLLSVFGSLGAKLVVAVVMVSFMSCILSLQAATSRLVFAYARDRMIVANDYLSAISPHTHVPTRALAMSGIVAAVIVCLGLFFQSAIGTIVNSAIIGIYAAFQMIVLGALTARLRGWKPGGRFTLGRWGLAVNLIALVYGIGAIIDMLWPRTPAAPWYLNYAMSITWLGIVGIGALYMVLGRPYDHGTAPAGDAWKLAQD
ncbi:MAG: amino acid permease [Alphaproteobacteria bacterium]|nr:amino acid permease [Alphaproteobacteria bacterium]MDE2013356.1 amino acid permease [Alphaproteobacteria bacterium]MDE2074577.1 amino acid permease [Alphaproteobacteria bacterium]MDE2351400.1 amino acid permease [Alphaproteobacteria bacterium]